MTKEAQEIIFAGFGGQGVLSMGQINCLRRND